MLFYKDWKANREHKKSQGAKALLYPSQYKGDETEKVLAWSFRVYFSSDTSLTLDRRHLSRSILRRTWTSSLRRRAAFIYIILLQPSLPSLIISQLTPLLQKIANRTLKNTVLLKTLYPLFLLILGFLIYSKPRPYPFPQNPSSKNPLKRLHLTLHLVKRHVLAEK